MRSSNNEIITDMHTGLVEKVITATAKRSVSLRITEEVTRRKE